MNPIDSAPRSDNSLISAGRFLNKPGYESEDYHLRERRPGLDFTSQIGVPTDEFSLEVWPG